MNGKYFLPVLLTFFWMMSNIAVCQIIIKDNPKEKVIIFGNNQLTFTLDYNKKCVITRMEVAANPVVSTSDGIFSEIRTASAIYSTKKLSGTPFIATGKDQITVSHIEYGDKDVIFKEKWIFNLSVKQISLNIERRVSKPVAVEEVAFPAIHFNSYKTWNGAFTDYGGLAWFYLFNEKLCTDGVHSGSSVFWNSKTGSGLKISAKSPANKIVSKFTRTDSDELLFAFSVAENEFKYRYDPGTNRRRFIRGKSDVWSPINLKSGTTYQSITFSYLDYNEEYGRGQFTGIDGNKVSDLLNTIARIGVIDANHFGGNSWHTPYGPICLHEQYIGLIGLAVNDPLYLKGYEECLDYYRDNAINPDGRVLSRWAYDDSDAMKGTATSKGFYEAQWGYLMDSNTDFVTNISELYQQTGDLKWVTGQKLACEKSLDYLLKRDSDKDFLVEMMNTDHKERKGSDWIDIIWAAWENAFINAKLYHALIQWSAVEKNLGDLVKAQYYTSFASGLKMSFNKPTTEGGFWDLKNQWYVHWLDKDNSVHGNNLVVPVNFMAIAYGICDDVQKRKVILDKVESQMHKEDLFAWPLCMYSYEKGEGNDWQFPFPNYENGDIFLSWGSVGVKAYAGYRPDLAMKYIQNILDRYEKDGLAFQRYGRAKQDGLGDDILSGNCLALVGLYESVYGINPQYNRLYLNPHLTDQLTGTVLKYNFRGDKLTINLDKSNYSIANQQFKVTANHDFGFNATKDQVEYFDSKNEKYSLKATISKPGKVTLEMIAKNDNEIKWKQVEIGNIDSITYTLSGLKPGKIYAIISNDKKIKSLQSDNKGSITFLAGINSTVTEIIVSE